MRGRRGPLLPLFVAIGASQARLVGSVAVHAPAHRDVRLPRQTVTLGYRTMTGMALRAGIQMGLVAEVNVARDLVDPDPWNRPAIARKRRQLLNRRALSLYR